jgi:hypothetical protein
VVGDWVSKKEVGRISSPEWVYHISNITHTTANAKEFGKYSSEGQIQVTSSHNTIIPLEGYVPVRVLT